jgi:hypothetical protein
MTTTKERIKNNVFYEAFKLYIKDNDNLKWDKYNTILKNTKILEKIGNESKYGEVFTGKIEIDAIENNSLISIKKVPLSVKDLQILLLNQINDRSIIFSCKTLWKEIYILKLCSKLVKMKKCIHLPLHYFFVYASHNNYTKAISKNNPHIYSYSELASEDLKSWSSKERTNNEWISCFLQIFFALYVLQHYCGFLHNDLHWGNILVFPIKKGGCWCYKIRGESFYIYNEGFLFVLWDFGMASLTSSLKECKEHVKACQDFLKILNTPKWVNKHYEDIIIPKSISDLCVFIRSDEYKSMNELLHKVIVKFSKTKKTYCLETYHISSGNKKTL